MDEKALADPSILLKELQQEYDSLGVNQEQYREEYEKLLAMTMERLHAARANRMSPNMADLWGSLSGLWSGKSSIEEGVNARNQAQAQLEKDPIDDITLLGGHFTEQGKQLNDLRKSVISRMNTAHGASERQIHNTPSGNIYHIDPITKQVTQIVSSQPNFKALTTAQKQASEEANSPGMEFRDITHKEQWVQQRASELYNAFMIRRDDKINPNLNMDPSFPAPTPPLGRPAPTTPAAAVSAPAVPPLGVPAPTTPAAAVPTERMSPKALGDSLKTSSLEFNPVPGQSIDSFRSEIKAAVPPGTKIPPIASTSAPAVSAPAVSATPKLFTAQQQDIRKSHIDINKKDLESLESVKRAQNSIRNMNSILNSGSTTAGAMHGFLNTLGNYVNLIDPNGKLAQSTQNDTVYYSEMMNLVRDKIKALGTGTAVSNLDFYVTEKSVGSLRESVEGNKKLMAIMTLQNATVQQHLEHKATHFRTFNDYLEYAPPSTDATHIIRANKRGKDIVYSVQSKDDWVKEQVKAGFSADAAMASFNEASTRATEKLLAGVPGIIWHPDNGK